MKILLCALEPSADALGGALMAALRAQVPDVQFIGCGGADMTAQGLNSLFDIEPFSVIGPAAALRLLPAALKAADGLADLADREAPDAAIFIDSWSFSRIAAEKLQRRAPGVKRFKYVAPQIWASRPKRAQKAAELFDGLLCLFEFETPMFERAGARARFVGHSGFQAAHQYRADVADFRRRHGFGDAPLLVVLPGSRRAELRRHAVPFGETVRRVADRIERLRIVIPAAASAAKVLPGMLADWPGEPVVIDSAERFDAYVAADAALAASGTVVGELAIFSTPMIVAYRIDLLTEIWARVVLTTKHVSLVNIAAGREIVPEFLQADCEPGAMADALAPLLTGGSERDAQKAAFPPVVEGWIGSAAPAAEMAASAVLEWLDERKTAAKG